MATRIAGVVSGLLLVVGAILPWASVSSILGTINVAGTEGDGVFTLLLGLAVAAMFGIWKRVFVIVGAALAGLALVIGGLHILDAAGADELSEVASVSIGFGLILTVVAAAAAIVLAIIGQAALAKAPAAAPAPAPAA